MLFLIKVGSTVPSTYETLSYYYVVSLNLSSNPKRYYPNLYVDRLIPKTRLDDSNLVTCKLQTLSGQTKKNRTVISSYMYLSENKSDKLYISVIYITKKEHSVKRLHKKTVLKENRCITSFIHLFIHKSTGRLLQSQRVPFTEVNSL